MNIAICWCLPQSCLSQAGAAAADICQRVGPSNGGPGDCQAANQPSHKHMFRSRKQTSSGSQTRLYVETNDAMAGMLIAINDQPLTPQEQQAEEDHLGWLAGTPEQLRKKHAREKEDAERTLRIVKALPDAFHYEYDGTEVGGPELGRPEMPS